MKIKMKLLIVVLIFIIINYMYEVYFNKPEIPIPTSYPSQHDYQLEVNQPNKSDKKDMFVLFFTSNSCAPCIKMKKLVWPDDKVQESCKRIQ